MKGLWNYWVVKCRDADGNLWYLSNLMSSRSSPGWKLTENPDWAYPFFKKERAKKAIADYQGEASGLTLSIAIRRGTRNAESPYA